MSCQYNRDQKIRNFGLQTEQMREFKEIKGTRLTTWNRGGGGGEGW